MKHLFRIAFMIIALFLLMGNVEDSVSLKNVVPLQSPTVEVENNPIILEKDISTENVSENIERETHYTRTVSVFCRECGELIEVPENLEPIDVLYEHSIKVHDYQEYRESFIENSSF